MTVGPGVVAALERFAAPELERCFERLRFGVAVGIAAGEELVELVEVDLDLAAVEMVALAFGDSGVAERGSCVGG